MKIIALLLLFAALPVQKTWALSTGNVAFCFDFKEEGKPGSCVSGAPVNSGRTICGMGGGSESRRDAEGSAPGLSKTSVRQSGVYSAGEKEATVFINGEDSGGRTFNRPFPSSSQLTAFRLEESGADADAEMGNLALRNKAITAEEEAQALAAPRPDAVLKGRLGKKVWNYSSREGWSFMQQNTDGSTGDNPEPKSVFEDGKLKITVRAGSGDRRKAFIAPGSTTGRYKWRLFLPERDGNSNMSVGAFIYNNDAGEIDFEIAAGKASERARYNAGEDELLAYMTNQGNPFHSTAVPVKPGWHTVELDLSGKNGHIYIQWVIDGKIVKRLQTQLPSTMQFSIWSSVENLGFAGDHPPSRRTTVPFDQVEYRYHP